jgi:predicted RNase H-like nuclease (RuvC/YqgF family)
MFKQIILILFLITQGTCLCISEEAKFFLSELEEAAAAYNKSFNTHKAIKKETIFAHPKDLIVQKQFRINNLANKLSNAKMTKRILKKTLQDPRMASGQSKNMYETKYFNTKEECAYLEKEIQNLKSDIVILKIWYYK